MVAHVREAFGWDEDVVVSAGPRGALGQIWRLDVGSERYALKEIFAEPPSEAVIEAELAFARRAAEVGVRRPASHPDRDGRHLLTAPDGTWLRLYDWVDVRPVELTALATPGELGTLLARLHRCAPAMAVEPGGGPPDPWYDHIPAAHEWAAASASGAVWAARLTDRLTTMPDLCAAVAPADPAELIVCHRDLHPQNVLADPAGALVVLVRRRPGRRPRRHARHVRRLPARGRPRPHHRASRLHDVPGVPAELPTGPDERRARPTSRAAAP